MSVLYGNIGYKMKKRVALLLAFILLAGMTLQASAASSGALSNCVLSISCDAEGVRVSFSEESSTYADEIGCRNIVLEEKNGSSWKTINVAGGYSKSSVSYGGTAVYRNATKGKTSSASS